jgi:hypothetical protein
MNPKNIQGFGDEDTLRQLGVGENAPGAIPIHLKVQHHMLILIVNLI